ncbi:MAG: Gamma-L-glutamyl-butirosin B gamma-glutamyl cyclotransferase [bacterium ADurb.Bin236]|nr:MAG: Gamma-L-glutamyl-butirosin B gamma-glutamyl cyclotransferase [bacterium ADurb.Bin236]HOY64726.1 gamma-glutamylcyclotransferase [bacterium]
MGISRLFVYGSLMSGFWNHERYCRDALTIEPAVTTGRLYHLPYGFPAMFDALDGQVLGEVMTFPDIAKTLEHLDRLEGYRPGDSRSHYIRIEKSVSILNGGKKAPAWVYVYPKERQRPDFILVPSGCWRRFLMPSIRCASSHF